MDTRNYIKKNILDDENFYFFDNGNISKDLEDIMIAQFMNFIFHDIFKEINLEINRYVQQKIY